MNRPGPGDPVEWVATPPGGGRPARREAPPRPYTGPPSYPVPPRWGFPPLGWRWPLALPTRYRADPVERVLSLSSTAITALWGLAGVAALACGAETWRYVLLLRSREEALPALTLAISDALVATAGVLTWLVGALAGVGAVLWALRARDYAGERAGVRPARPDWRFVVGVLVPGANLVVPGCVLAELEHTVLADEGARDLDARPSPSRLVRAWWATWVVSLLLSWVTFCWRFRGGVQAMADGVVLHAWTDAVAAVLAVLTLHVIKQLTRLLTPVDTTEVPHPRVLTVRGAPEPRRPERPDTVPR